MAYAEDGCGKGREKEMKRRKGMGEEKMTDKRMTRRKRKSVGNITVKC